MKHTFDARHTRRSAALAVMVFFVTSVSHAQPKPQGERTEDVTGETNRALDFPFSNEEAIYRVQIRGQVAINARVRIGDVRRSKASWYVPMSAVAKSTGLFHSLFPVVPDRGSWASRGHAALVLPVEGDPVLITDYLDDPEDRIKVLDVRCVADITAGTTAALGEVGLLGKSIGLVGGASFLASAERRMRSAPGGDTLDLTPADQILEDLRSIKSPAELTALRHAAEVGVLWMNTTFAALQEGRTEGDAVGEGLRVLAAHGGIQQDV
ncbi:MAG: hypothetical protein AAGI01_07080, partial [Myxococcota bacterium]